MKPIEIIVIILATSYVLLIIGRYIYKRAKHLPTGDCANCNFKKGAEGLKEYYYAHKCDGENCNCDK